MSQANDCIGEWLLAELVDPRGQVLVEEKAADTKEVNAWPIQWSHRRVGLLSNKKPNADAMLEEVKQGLLAAVPALSFVYGSKEPLAKGAPESVIESFRDCDVVVLASAECGGCTSWVCHDYITLEQRGIPCLIIATNRFEKLARYVLTNGGITNPHLAIPQHPVSGITAEQAQIKIRGLMGRIRAEMLGSAVEETVAQLENA